MDRKKAALLAAAVLLAAAMAAAVAAGIFALRRSTDYDWVVGINWGISLPQKAGLSQVYKENSEPSFHGDGIRYHVYSCTDPEPVEQMVSWGPEGLTRHGESFTEAAESWLTEIEVPPEQWPGREAVFWYQCQDDGSELILFWEREEKTLRILESFL